MESQLVFLSDLNFNLDVWKRELKFQESEMDYFEEKLVSIAIYFEKDKTRYLYNMASDTDYYDYSPGLLHIAEFVEKTVENGYDEFNFLRGEERYKFEIGANSCSWNCKINLH